MGNKLQTIQNYRGLDQKNNNTKNTRPDQSAVMERMASVGMLATGAVHQINNPLTQVLANLELAFEELTRLGSSAEPGRYDRVSRLLKKVSANATRIESFVHDIKTFSRPSDEKIAPIDLRSVLESSLSIVSREILDRARLVKNFSVVPPVRANGGQLSQAFLNLMANAAQAIPEGDQTANEIRISTSVDVAGCVVVSISDTGVGIPEQIRERIFDPFFTTKSPEEGAGLGLSIAKSVIQSYGGEIKIESMVGKGTTVMVIFPGPEKRESITAVTPHKSVQTKRGRVLVIDDEAGIGDLLSSILSDDYDVVTMSSPPQALKLLLEGSNFDVILCDLMMPEVTGMEIFDRLRKARPEMEKKFIFMTGGAFTPQTTEFLQTSTNLNIQKPFKINVLRQLVQGIIGGR